MADADARPAGLQLQPVLRVTSLRSVPRPALLALLRAERDTWARRLRWSPPDPGQVLELAASSGMLQGLALQRGEELIGYGSTHSSPGLFRVGSFYLRPEAPPESVDLLVAALLGSNDGRRFEAQLSAFEWQDQLDRAMTARGVTVTPRDWLALDLRRLPAEPTGLDLRLAPWTVRSIAECADLLVQAHQGSTEAAINATFRDRRSAHSYLEDLVRGPGCGRFSPSISRLAHVDGRLAGFCVVTDVGPAAAHLPQVAVAPDCWGGGVGTALLLAAATSAREAGHSWLTLSVSRSNARAAEWYRRLGFQGLSRFSAYHADG
ncbi:MAG: N-acetyltransferase [Acidobacteriota bacterium]